MKKTITILLSLFLFAPIFSQKKQNFQLVSPNGKIVVTIAISNKITWTITHEKGTVLSVSPMSMAFNEGEIVGKNPILKLAKKESIRSSFETPFYKKKTVEDNYNQLLMNFKGDFSIEYRAFDEGVAYRFITKKKKDITVQSEEVVLNFDQDYTTLMPYVRDLRNPKDPYISSFESHYENKKISEFAKDTLAFLPFLVDLNNQKKAVFLEANLQDYPGMFVTNNKTKSGFEGRFPKYPLQEMNGGFNNLNKLISQRADYLVTTKGTRNFPWRIVVISEKDMQVAFSYFSS